MKLDPAMAMNKWHKLQWRRTIDAPAAHCNNFKSKRCAAMTQSQLTHFHDTQASEHSGQRASRQNICLCGALTPELSRAAKRLRLE